jgi:fatty-acyl-CoA synthase
MAAITPGEGFKLEGLRDHLVRELPGYARPIFVRMTPAIETTGTFKYRKVDLVRDGFDPAKIEQAVYFDDPDAHRYVQITGDLYTRIQTGAYKL